jgi:RND family efflux transporter MFP subunit
VRQPTRRSIGALIALAVVALAVVAWRAVGPQGTTEQAVIVRRGDLTTTIETSGRLVARKNASISSIASGTVRIVAVREGEAVRRGDVLIVLDDAPARDEIARAERAVESAETKVSAARGRAQGDTGTLADAAAAENDAASARAALATANDRLVATHVLAPFDGVIGGVRVGEGANYGAGGELATIADASDLYATADLDEVDRPSVGVGQGATLSVTAFPAASLSGRITAVSDTAQSRGGSTVYPVQLAFDRPADGALALLPGMTIDVRLTVAARKGVLILPGNAIRTAGSRRYVTVRRDGRPTEVEIQTGARSGGDVEIASGLAEGDVVILR